MSSEVKKLAHLFTDVWKLYNEIEDSTEPSVSATYQAMVKKAIDETVHLTELVDQLDLYSSNEEFEEVATKDLKFMLLPAILGKLHMKKTSLEAAQRPPILEAALTHLNKFLQTCFNYGLGPLGQIKRALASDGDRDADEVKPKLDAGGNPDLKVLVETRDEKIRRYKASKQRKEEIAQLTAKGEDNLDEDLLRSYWKLQVDQWIEEVVDEVTSIHEEKKMLKFMRNRGNEVRRPPTQPSTVGGKKFAPFMLTKDKLQAQVFGHGYPSLPTMSVEEFYEREMAAGRTPDSGNGVPDTAEEDEDSDSDEKLMKQRDMDDFKDTHRRGDGNRYRKG